jgi:hypothetical protein
VPQYGRRPDEIAVLRVPSVGDVRDAWADVQALLVTLATLRRFTLATIERGPARSYDPPLRPPGGPMALSDVRAAATDIRRRLDQIRDSL